MTLGGDPADPLRGSDDRFRRGRAELAEGLRALLGPRAAAEPLDDPGRAAALAAEAVATQRDARRHPWAVVRAEWEEGERRAAAELLHAVSAYAGPRPAWLVVPGRDPQAVAVGSEAVLDNPLGFAALARGELVLLDQELPAGVWLAGPAAGAARWRLEVWGAEPWLSAATRALREQRQRRTR